MSSLCAQELEFSDSTTCDDICPASRTRRPPPDVLHISDCQRSSYLFRRLFAFPRSTPEHGKYTHFLFVVKGSGTKSFDFLSKLFRPVLHRFPWVPGPLTTEGLYTRFCPKRQIPAISIPKIYSRVKWSRAGSNRQPPGCKPGALPVELRPRKKLSALGFQLSAGPVHQDAQLSHPPQADG